MRSVSRAGTMRAAIYIRVSSEGQRENYSPETQEEACRDPPKARPNGPVQVGNPQSVGQEGRRRGSRRSSRTAQPDPEASRSRLTT